jgi:hypothetical protein
VKTTHPLLAPRHAVAAAALLALLGPTQAADWEFSGLVRQELAVKTTNDQNIANQYGTGVAGQQFQSSALGAAPGDTLGRPAKFDRDIDVNWFASRAELNVDGKINESLKATIKVRGIYDWTPDVESTLGKFPAGNNSGKTFKQDFGGTCGGTLCYASSQGLLDLPAAYVDYNNGPLWIRTGNQQIAWGEALFFRVSDQPNGLDLRGNLFGIAAEEYSDKRRSSLGARINYRLSDKSDIDTFVQKFQATLLPNGETAYNVIPDQFTIDQRPGYNDAKNKWNFGARYKGEIGGVGFQAFAISRMNPDGTYKWTTAKGTDYPADGAALDATTGLPTGVLTGTAAEAQASGVWSKQEWFNGAGYARLNGIQGVGTFMDTTRGTAYGGATSFVGGACGVTDTGSNYLVANAQQAGCVLDTFFTAFGPLRGHLQREYDREVVLGGGLNHVFEGEPDSFTDQLIGRFEFSWTPDKEFTNPTLGPYIKANEYQYAFIAEKYHKFTSAFPATYFVAQWLHKQRSDIFGRWLGGVDNQPGTVPDGQSGGFNAFALAIQQPSPTLEYRFDLAVLTDAKGGWYAQPGVKWKPSKSIQADLYLNWFYSANEGEYKDWADGLQNNNEIFARLAYLF